MKITGSKFDKVYNATTPAMNSKNDRENSLVQKQDKIELSKEAKKFCSYKDKINSAVIETGTDVDLKKLAALKKKIENGTYNVSSEDIAAAILGTNRKE